MLTTSTAATGGRLQQPPRAKSSEGLEERYGAIAAAQGRQQAKYEAWVASSVDGPALCEAAAALGLALDLPSGTIAYAEDFDAKRLRLGFDLLYVRHGKTTGNTEPRVYQGNVDEPSNALNEVGRQQAQDAADLLDAQLASGETRLPSLVVLSPLARAFDTGRAFLGRHAAELDGATEVWPESGEMAFGSWDNELVKDLPDDSIAHLFYLSQNAVVRSEDPYDPAKDPRRLEDGPGDAAAAGSPPTAVVPAENFVEVLQRMHGVLLKLEARVAEEEKKSKTTTKEPPLVLMYGHSMAGAALGILTGNGKQVEGDVDPPCLGFDGKYILPNAQPVLLYKAGV